MSLSPDFFKQFRHQGIKDLISGRYLKNTLGCTAFYYIQEWLTKLLIQFWVLIAKLNGR
jgi:hypothetical protein